VKEIYIQMFMEFALVKSVIVKPNQKIKVMKMRV
jgi:hypothetical protein